VELLHTYTLVHDDLPCMDDDAERRGKPTVHVAFGEANAVLAGDALQALAFGVLASAPDGPPGVAARLAGELARAAGSRGVVGGQVEDLAAPADADAEAIASIHLHKTADLFRAALRMGAIAGGGGEEQVEALGTFGRELGLGFQIVDDLLDGPRSEAGQGHAETTCLSVYTTAQAAALAAGHTDAARRAVAGLASAGSAPLLAIAGHLLERDC
jgi:geranylgeranyl pyrophosphate synthase